MARRNRVPVYSRNAQSAGERPLRYTTEEEAFKLIADGKAKRVSQRHAPLKIQMLALERIERDSPCAISLYEMEANAGLHGDKAYQRVFKNVIEPWLEVGMPRYRACSM